MFQAINGIYQWDDGTKLTYSNPDWKQKSDRTHHYTVLIKKKDEVPYWLNLPHNESVPNGVYVICKQAPGGMTTTRVGSSGMTAIGPTTNKMTPEQATGQSRQHGKVSSAGLRNTGVIMIITAFHVTRTVIF